MIKKAFFRNIHLYLSLSAGLIIMLSCITGAIMVFEEEIEHTIHHERYFVKPEPIKLPASKLIDNALKVLPKAKFVLLRAYGDNSRTVEIGLSLPEKKGVGLTAESKDKTSEKSQKPGDAKKAQKGGGKPSHTVYVNPYTGKVIEVLNRKESFFFTVEMLHRWLLTGNDGVGKTIVGFSTLFFLFILITGLILWWPKTKNILKQRLKIKADGGWKRFNHDMHIVTGFYISVFLIITVVTGLVMSFNWLNKGIFTLTGSQMENPEAPTSLYSAAVKPVTIDLVCKEIMRSIKDVESYSIRSPKDSAGVFSISVLPENRIESAPDNYYIDQYSGKLLSTYKASDKNTGQKIRSYVKPIHTGSVYGLPTKILSFIICLLALTFPITGVTMWLNRLKAKSKRNRSLV